MVAFALHAVRCMVLATKTAQRDRTFERRGQGFVRERRSWSRTLPDGSFAESKARNKGQVLTFCDRYVNRRAARSHNDESDI
jgi:hypothetical protein